MESQNLEIKTKSFLDEAISDGEQASFGRLGSLIALIFSCIWISILVWRVEDFSGLPNLAIFIGACCAFITALYGVSKTGDTIAEFKDGLK